MNLTTTWMGLPLKNPLVPSASPLSKALDKAKKLEDAGASALVMYSLFEEEVISEEQNLAQLLEYQPLGHGEACDFLPSFDDFNTKQDEYLAQLSALKMSLDIPIIASLNGITESGWVEHAKELEETGADALELNIFYIPTDLSESAQQVEARYIHILKALKQHINIPVAVKLSSQFSSPGHFVRQLEQAGADAVVLFNRFYQPDLDLDTLKVQPTLQLSSPQEALLRMHWIGLMHGQVNLSLGATGGIHDASQVIKMLLVGADITQLCSVLLQEGPEKLSAILQDLTRWMEENEYESVEQLKGSVSHRHAGDTSAYEHANYLEVLRRYTL